MKLISLEEAYSLLEQCAAVVVDNNAVVYPSLWGLTDDEEDDFLYLSWEDEGDEFNLKFSQGPNGQVKVENGIMYLIESKGEVISLLLLEPKKI